ncbi:unnamed protein product [Alopecurus aequalis]
MIKLGRYTQVEEKPGVEPEYPFCTFSLTPITDLTSPTDLPHRFTDVAGIITGVLDATQYHSANRAEPSTKRIIYLSDISGNQISIVLWGERAIAFEGEWVLETSKENPMIAIFVGTLVKSYEGRRGLSGSAACRWYINEDLPEINTIHARLKDKIPQLEIILLPNQTAAQISAEVDLETKTVGDLIDLDIWKHEHIKFFCTVTILKLSPLQRWWFFSCNSCHKSSVPYGNAYKCSGFRCVEPNATPRYRVCYIGGDGQDEELAAVVSTKYRFVVQVTSKSFESECTKPSYQVHRIDTNFGKQLHSSALRKPEQPTGSFGKSPPIQFPLILGSSSTAGSPSHSAVSLDASPSFTGSLGTDQAAGLLPAVTSPPSVNKLPNLRHRTKDVPSETGVRKPLFQEPDQQVQAAQTGKDLPSTDSAPGSSSLGTENPHASSDDLLIAPTDKVAVEETLPEKAADMNTSSLKLPEPVTDKRRRSQTEKGSATAQSKKTKN